MARISPVVRPFCDRELIAGGAPRRKTGYAIHVTDDQGKELAYLPIGGADH
jgi:hypothetical protein